MNTRYIFLIRGWWVAAAISMTLLLCGSPSLSAQTLVTKKGGIGFRVDDNQPLEQLKAYSDVFLKNDAVFSLAINLGITPPTPGYAALLRDMQRSGHEIMDHTPNHRTQYFTTGTPSAYFDRPGVDHIVGGKVCLQLTPLVKSNPNAERGFGILVDNRFVSYADGGFRQFQSSSEFIGIYVPQFDRTYFVREVSANVLSDPDTLFLTSEWEEPVWGDATDSLEYQVITQRDISLTDEAAKLLVERALILSTSYGLERPTTWIQPGGRFPALPIDQIQRIMGENYRYTAAASAFDVARKWYNEPDHRGDRRFGMQWGDFYEDFASFKSFKSFISASIAKHHVVIGHSHFTGLLGDFPGYLLRMDSLLQWSHAKSIPIFTYRQWADELYSNRSSAEVNIFPVLFNDLDEDNIPDAYDLGTHVVLDTTAGVPRSRGRALKVYQGGRVFSITNLAGIERDGLEFQVAIKAIPSTEFIVSFKSRSTLFASIKFVVTDSVWQRFSSLETLDGANGIRLPDTLSAVDVEMVCSKYVGGQPLISGFAMQSPLSMPLKIVSRPDTVTVPGKKYTYTIEVSTKTPAENVNLSIVEMPSWITYDGFSTLSGIVPEDYKKGTVNVRASNEVGFTDVQSFVLGTTPSETNQVQIIPGDGTFRIIGNYPNPFNGGTNVTFEVKERGFATVEIVDILGRVVKTIKQHSAIENGIHDVYWDGRDALQRQTATGVYFACVSIDFEDTQLRVSKFSRIVLVK